MKGLVMAEGQSLNWALLRQLDGSEPSGVERKLGAVGKSSWRNLA